GSPTNLTLTVANTGSGTLTNIKLSSTPPTNWTVTFGPSPVVQGDTIASLDPNKSQDITATITPASDAITGDYVLTITATASESAATASTDFRITVVTSLIWGLVAVVIIVLVLVGLFYVFRRYGRR
ncbi:MAG TPA: NEW3 domain-containing protein, partial [Candidatus Binatia bacterium]|nr:NEW3 domain-containing protein [Candidatus Binatia bacterium]